MSGEPDIRPFLKSISVRLCGMSGFLPGTKAENPDIRSIPARVPLATHRPCPLSLSFPKLCKPQQIQTWPEKSNS